MIFHGILNFLITIPKVGLIALPLALHAIPIQTSTDENGIYGVYGKDATQYGPIGAGQTYFQPPSSNHTAGGDQALFQNLLAAEWIVEGMYAAGLQTFNKQDFINAGYANNTYEQLQAVYENENGHLRLFENAIDEQNIKPGRCNYTYGIEQIANKTEAAKLFVNIVSQVEIGSMAYLTGLAQEAQSMSTLSTIMGTISAETRHLTFVNGQVLDVGDFVGPTDTTYPWPLQILSVTKQFIVPNSCPKTNPAYPSPDQKLPKLSIVSEKSNIQRENGTLTIEFQNATHGDLPGFNKTSSQANDLHAIFFHSVFNYTVPATFTGNGSLIQIEMPTLTANNGNLLISLANTSNVQNEYDIVAGPLQIELGLPDL